MLPRLQLAHYVLSSFLTFSSPPTYRHYHVQSASWKVQAPAGANFPRVASFHERAVLIPSVVFPRVRPVPRETVILKHRRAPGSQSRHSPKVCVLPCRGLRDESSRELCCWPGPSLLSSSLDPASDAPASCVYHLGLRAPTGRANPPGVPHSPSALWTCHPHPIQESQAEEFPCALSARDDVSTVP